MARAGGTALGLVGESNSAADIRAFRQGQRAVRHFKAVGLSSPNRAITQTP